MDESKSAGIAHTWVRRLGAHIDEYESEVASILNRLPDPEAWAIAEEDLRLAVRGGGRLYVMGGTVENGHLRAIDTRVLDLSNRRLASSRTYVPDDEPGHDTHTWTLSAETLETCSRSGLDVSMTRTRRSGALSQASRHLLSQLLSNPRRSPDRGPPVVLAPLRRLVTLGACPDRREVGAAGEPRALGAAERVEAEPSC
jgi:hypothetical protein